MALPTIAPYRVPTESELPDGKVSWTPDAARAVLLVHDMQRYFVSAYEDSVEPLSTVVPNIARLRSRAHKLGMPVVYSAQPGDQSARDRRLLSEFWGPGLSAIEEHESIIPELEPAADDVLLTKWRYSAFQRTDLLRWLHDWERDQLIVTGVYAHMGCLMTACEAFMQDIQAFLVGDAVADFSLDDHRMTLRYAALRCGVATSTERVCSQLSRELEGSMR